MLMLVADLTRHALFAGVEEVLRASPDDECLHRAYASTLLQSRDPADAARGRLIEAQLKLEDPDCPADQRRKLEARRRKLIRDHGRGWLGGLADYLLGRPDYRFELWRGWLERVLTPAVEADFIAELARAPQARLLRRLEFASAGPGGPQVLAVLRQAEFFE